MATAGPGSLRRLAERAEDAITTRRQQRANARLRDEQGLAERVARSRRFVFLCYGNINRSAVAERHLQHLLGDEVEVRSCGLHDVDGRAADPTMVEVAAGAGISLDPWSSRRADAALIGSADLVLAMEAWHLTRLQRLLPQSRGRAYLLGATTDDPAVPLEIADPYGRSTADYERAFAQVTAATGHLAALVRPGD